MYTKITKMLLMLLFGLFNYCHASVEPQNPVVNQEFKITIPTARSTTYDWYFKEIRKQISPAGLLVPLEPAWVILYGTPTYTIQGQPLKNESKIFTFKAMYPGTVVLLFQKKHRYKSGKKVIETKEIKVAIREK